MSKYSNRTQWLVLGLTVCLSSTALTHAGQPKDKSKLDLEAEAKQAADEDAREAAEREQGIRGNYQRVFLGTFLALPELNDKISPEVVGSFVTSNADTKPGRAYQVKVENGSKSILEALKRTAQKKVQVTGRLRVFGPDGEGKYLVVSAVLEVGATPRSGERRKGSGI